MALSRGRRAADVGKPKRSRDESTIRGATPAAARGTRTRPETSARSRAGTTERSIENEALDLQKRTYQFCREELLREVVTPVASGQGMEEVAGELLDHNVEWVCSHTRLAPIRELTRREERAGAALRELRAAMGRFNDIAESLSEGRKKDRERGVFESVMAKEAAVGAVHFFTGKLVGKRPINLAPDTVHWAAAHHALGKHKDHLEPRALLVLDIDRYRGLLGSPWVNPSTAERERVPAPHLSLRHLAMLSILSGNWPDQSGARSPYDVVTAERKAIRKQLETLGIERARAQRESAPKPPAELRQSLREPRQRTRIPERG